MDAAASSIKRDGIGCTSKLEQTLFDDMNGLCRELMAELLAAGAATAKDYLAKPGERNAGNHGKRIVTLFGELPEIKRTYYWDDDSRTGHYPFDDRLGLVGRYTSAAANEMVRHAVDHRQTPILFPTAHSCTLSRGIHHRMMSARRSAAARENIAMNQSQSRHGNQLSSA